MTDHRRPHGQISLPKPLTSFIGREGELRGGRHVLVVPAAHEVSVLSEAALRPFRADLEVVTGDGATGPVILVRPDGHVAARGRPRSMEPVTGYLRDLFREPAGHPRAHPADGALLPCAAPPHAKDDLEDARFT